MLLRYAYLFAHSTCHMKPGEQLEAWRKANRMTQAHLSELLGLSQGAVSRIEAGAEPKASVAEKIRHLTSGAVTWSEEAAPISQLPHPSES